MAYTENEMRLLLSYVYGYGKNEFENFKDFFQDLYFTKNTSDSEIAKILNTQRENVRRLRMKYDIKSKDYIIKEKVIDFVNKKLVQQGFEKAIETSYHNYSINGRIVKVNHSNNFRVDHFQFSLVYKGYRNFEKDENKIIVGENRYKYKYVNLCDFIIYVGRIYNDPLEFWVLTSKEIDEIENNYLYLGRYFDDLKDIYMNVERIFQ